MQRQEAGLKYHPCLVSNPDPKQPTMKLPYPATILLVLITTVSYAITRVSPKKNFIDVEKYSICITINESDSSIRCTTLIRFKSYKNSRKIWFNFRGLDLDSCLFEGKPVSYSRNKRPSGSAGENHGREPGTASHASSAGSRPRPTRCTCACCCRATAPTRLARPAEARA